MFIQPLQGPRQYWKCFMHVISFNAHSSPKSRVFTSSCRQGSWGSEIWSSLMFRKWQRQDWNSISLQSLGSQLLFCTVWFLNVYRVTWECEGILLKVTTHVSPCGLFRYRFYSHKSLADYRYVPWFITRKCLLNWSQYQICCTSWAKGVLWPVQQDVYLIFYFVIMIFDF